jgi:hypothetical protein
MNWKMEATLTRNLDQLLEMWARWIQHGCNQPRGFDSILHALITTRGQRSGSNAEPNDSLETRVEGAVSLLSLRDEAAAFVLRVEYGAIYIRDLDPHARQIDKAHALAMPVRTYKNRLQRARGFVAEWLKVNG